MKTRSKRAKEAAEAAAAPEAKKARKAKGPEVGEQAGPSTPKRRGQGAKRRRRRQAVTKPAGTKRQAAAKPAGSNRQAAAKPAPKGKHRSGTAAGTPKGTAASAGGQPEAAPKAGSKAKGKAASPGGAGAPQDSVTINRAPVLTLWAAVVAAREGYSWEESLTFGRYVASILAHSKGKSLGMYEDREKTEEEKEARRRRDREMGVQSVRAFGMKVPTVEGGGAGGGRRALSGGKALDASSVQSYLQRSFGAALEATQAAMEELASAIPPARIGKVCYKLYETFRPGWKGWGQKGSMSLSAIRQLASEWQQHT